MALVIRGGEMSKPTIDEIICEICLGGKKDTCGKAYCGLLNNAKQSMLNLLVEGLPKEYNIFDDETVPTEDGRRLVNNTIKWCRANIEMLLKGGEMSYAAWTDVQAWVKEKQSLEALAETMSQTELIEGLVTLVQQAEILLTQQEGK
jgi:hypothetical protein